MKSELMDCCFCHLDNKLLKPKNQSSAVSALFSGKKQQDPHLHGYMTEAFKKCNKSLLKVTLPSLDLGQNCFQKQSSKQKKFLCPVFATPPPPTYPPFLE
jgi:hypothetical protein